MLIVENAELFFAKALLFEKLNRIFGLQLSMENTDLLYGSGNQVTNKLNKTVLSEYESIYFVF